MKRYDPLILTRLATTIGVLLMALFALIFSIGALWVWPERSEQDPANPKSKFYQKSAGEIMLYKRTHPSAKVVRCPRHCTFNTSLFDSFGNVSSSASLMCNYNIKHIIISLTSC